MTLAKISLHCIFKRQPPEMIKCVSVFDHFGVLVPTGLPNRSDECSIITAQKVKFSIKDFFSKCDQIHRKLRIWSHLLKKYLMEKFIFCVVYRTSS